MNEVEQHVKKFMTTYDFNHAEWDGEILICYDSNNQPWEVVEFLDHSGTKNTWVELENYLEEQLGEQSTQFTTGKINGRL